jgi:hypothetical protein
MWDNGAGNICCQGDEPQISLQTWFALRWRDSIYMFLRFHRKRFSLSVSNGNHKGEVLGVENLNYLGDVGQIMLQAMLARIGLEPVIT